MQLQDCYFWYCACIWLPFPSGWLTSFVMASGWLQAAVLMVLLFCVLPWVPGVLPASRLPLLLEWYPPTCGQIISICPQHSLNSGSLHSHKCLRPWANPVSLADRIHDRITSPRAINIIWALINFKLWKEVFMSSKRYCLQKELSWGICNLFGSSDTSEVSGRGRRVPFSSQSTGTAQAGS